MNNKAIKNALSILISGLFVAMAMFLPINKAEAGPYGSDWGTFDSGGYVSDYTPYDYGGYVSDYSAYDYGGYVSDYTPYSYDSYDYGGYVSDYTPYSYDTGGYVSDYTPYSYDNYDYYGSTPSYGGYSGYTAPSYVYNTPTRGTSGGSAAAPSYQYVYSSNTNKNTNANANENNNNLNNSNTFNPTNINNNDARINLIVYGGGGSNTPAPTPALNGNCVISPTTAYINQDVSFSASATGGNGSYSYSWTGDNGINSAAQSFTGRYSYAGYKTATVTIRSGSESITRTCGVTIQESYSTAGAYCVASPSNASVNQNVAWTVYVNNSNGYYNNYSYTWSGTDGLYGTGQTIARSYNTPGYKTANVTIYGNGQTFTATCSTNINAIYAAQSNVTVIRDNNLGTPVSGVFLSEVPATGIGFSLKMALFSVGLILWSLFAALMIARKKNAAVLSKISAFKLANMQKKGIIG